MDRATAPANPVRIERDPATPDVARLVIDHPPVNALSHVVRVGLLDAITQIAADASVKAAVLMGANRTFVAGSDIREFGAPLEEPQLPAVIRALEDCPKPIVAAIEGVALGGGYELALGCDARVALKSASIGLPEVTLGLLPGAGGTVKLPRLAGAIKALDVILTGRRVPAPEAAELGMIDAVVDHDVAAAAARNALTIGKRRLGEAPVPAFDAAAFESEAVRLSKRAKSRAAAAAAVASVRRATELPFAAALAAEREAFQAIRVTEEAAAFRHLFFAERQAGRIDPPVTTRRTVDKVAVVGAGLMGAGIASAFTAAGFPVVLIEIKPDALAAGLARLDAIADDAVRTGRITPDERERRRALVTPTTDLGAVRQVDLVIEAVFEDMAVKTDLFGKLDDLAAPGAILASNTSYLDLDAMAAVTRRPESVVGLHFFSPAHIMRLLEVVRGAKTAPDVLDAAVRIGRRLKKLPVIARVGEGFIGNRIFSAYRTQCEFMLEDGALPDQIDAALTGFGFAMGPFATWDMAGLDIAWQTRQRLAATRGPGERVVPFLEELCRSGRLGRKTGAGWYRYEDGRTPCPDPAVTAMIAARAAERGQGSRPDADAIVEGALGAIINTAALVIEDGIAASAGDVDLVLTNGYGFPASRGGPLFWASRRPPAAVSRMVDRVADATGPTFRHGPVEAVLATLR